MTWSYGNNPSANEIDAVRLMIGDTIDEECSRQLSDEEIQFYLDQWCNPTVAAAEACLALAAKYSRRADEKVGDVSVSYSQTAKQYLELAQSLKNRSNIYAGKVICGGISKSDKQTIESNGDRVEPAFTKRTHDNVRVTETRAELGEDDI